MAGRTLLKDNSPGEELGSNVAAHLGKAFGGKHVANGNVLLDYRAFVKVRR